MKILKNRKVAILSTLAFLSSYNYAQLKIIKDSLITFSKTAAGETIPFIEIWGVLPCAILFSTLFVKLSSKISAKFVFSIFLIAFLLFFSIFSFALYDNLDFLQMNLVPNFMTKILPNGFRGLISIIKYWPFSMFYVATEIWSIIVIHLILWNLIITNVNFEEGKRIFGTIIFFFNIGTIFAGFTSTLTFSLYKIGHQSAMSIVIIFSAIIFSILINIERCNFNCFQQQQKKKLSLLSSLKTIFYNKCLLNVTLIVLSYNVINTLLEILWKHQSKMTLIETSNLCKYYGKITYITGIASAIISGIFLTPIMRKFSLGVSAIITPLIMASISTMFLSSIANFPNFLPLFSRILSPTFFGSLLIISMRSLRYTIFEATKELALTPLNCEQKLYGKIAIDGISSKIGRSGASVLCQLFIIAFSSLTNAIPAITFVIIAFFTLWFFSVNKLGKIAND